MADVAFVAIVMVFFALAVGLVGAFDRMIGEPDVQDLTPKDGHGTGTGTGTEMLSR